MTNFENKKSEIAVIGLAVMGANLARNLARNGYRVSVYNRTGEVTKTFIAQYSREGAFREAQTLLELVQQLERPRKVILMIQAGVPVDKVTEDLLSLLEPGDIILDGGNSLYTDTILREKKCKDKGIFFLGVGISGGEEGALNGPCIMPGGDKEAWKNVNQMLAKISAKTDRDCTAYIGPDGAGHFVKMVHNGIEYGDMQLIAEAYSILKNLGNFSNQELGEIFTKWNQGRLESYLTEITAKIFTVKDPLENKKYLIDQILDTASQKGTGRWTIDSAIEFGVPVPTLSASVDARLVSSEKSLRVHLSKNKREFQKNKSYLALEDLVKKVEACLFFGKVIAYTQGIELLRAASLKFNWNLNFSEIADIWKGGCIIRAKVLDYIKVATLGSSAREDRLLFSSKEIYGAILESDNDIREVIAGALLSGLPLPALSSALSYYDLYTTNELPLNLTQAQRDFFGAHTYQRIDREGSFHTEWS